MYKNIKLAIALIVVFVVSSAGAATLRYGQAATVPLAADSSSAGRDRYEPVAETATDSSGKPLVPGGQPSAAASTSKAAAAAGATKGSASAAAASGAAASSAAGTVSAGSGAVAVPGSPAPTPSPGMPPLPLAGAATRSDSTNTWNAFKAQVGNLQARRTYSGSLPSTFAASPAGPDVARGVVSFWSFKPTPSTFASGAQDAAFTSFLNSIPASHKTYITLYHEPENNIAANEFTLASWKAATNRMGSLIHATGRSELKSMIIIMGPWTFSSSGYASQEFWDPGFDANVDFIGIDPYSTSNNYTNIVNSSNTTAMMSWIRAHNKPWGITEIGAHEPTPNPSAKASWITRQWAWAKANSAVCFLYFNVNSTTDGSITDAQSSIIAPGSAAETAFRAIVTEANN